MKYSVCFATGLILMGCSGCETLSARQRRQGETRLHSDIANLKVSVQRLEQRLDGIEAGNEQVHAQIADLRHVQDRAFEKNGASFQEIERKMAAQSTALKRIRKEMVADLSQRMAKIIQSQPRPARAASDSGYEHVVKPGETLSEIAKAYGVKAKVITSANKLKNPDDLRVGQKLFIPE
jgi:LysM repeat protein